jgi:hypothetical protein
MSLRKRWVDALALAHGVERSHRRTGVETLALGPLFVLGTVVRAVVAGAACIRSKTISARSQGGKEARKTTLLGAEHMRRLRVLRHDMSHRAVKTGK